MIADETERTCLLMLNMSLWLRVCRSGTNITYMLHTLTHTQAHSTTLYYTLYGLPFPSFVRVGWMCSPCMGVVVVVIRQKAKYVGMQNVHLHI